MEFLPGFAWPLPRAFASAVGVCRFEQGDVLYDTKAAYTDWRDALPALGFHMQVLDPPRSARAAPADADGSRFAANWDSPVEIELRDYRRSITAVRSITQGRLFTCLWRGQARVLSEAAAESGVPLPLPMLARDLHGRLAEATPALRREASAVGARPDGLLFALVVDHASEASLAKASAVRSALASRFDVYPICVSPAGAALEAAAAYHPALQLHGTAIDASDEDGVRSVLKSVLYAPVGGGEGVDGSRPDRFKLERHGLLVPTSGCDGR